jgi:CubicO group peptidase (beta-lactamase class C family)
MNYFRTAGLLALLSCLASPAPATEDLAMRAQAMLASDIAHGNPGAVALVARGDQVLFRSAAGVANLELDVPLSAEQRFHIGSITKTLTAATVLKLAAAHKLSLDGPLSRYLPDFPNGSHITLAQLLDHTAGIGDDWEANPAEALDTRTLVKRIADKAPDFAPGTAWRYSNSGYMLLGAVIERVTGQPWDRAMHDLVLVPAGMEHTLYAGDEQIVPGQVEGYSVDERGNATHAAFASMTGPGAAGALTSTADDLFKFLRALHGDLLPPEWRRAMTSPKTTSDGQQVPYGYGVATGTVRGKPVWEHNGGIPGFATQYTYFPEQDVTVVVLANTDGGRPNPRALAHRLGALAVGDPYTVWTPRALSVREMQPLAGSYRISGDSVHTLGVRDAKLTIRRDGGPERELAAAAGDVLYYAGDGTDYIHVVRGAKGQPVALEFHADGMPASRREPRLP